MNSDLLIVIFALVISSEIVFSQESDSVDIVKACLNDTGATSEDGDNFFFNNKPTFSTLRQKCLAGCLYEGFGLLLNGSISKTGFENYIAKNFEEEVQTKIANCPAKIADLGDDRCVTGPALHSCISSGFDYEN